MPAPVYYRCAVCDQRVPITDGDHHERKHRRRDLQRADLEQRKLSPDATPDNAGEFM